MSCDFETIGLPERVIGSDAFRNAYEEDSFRYGEEGLDTIEAFVVETFDVVSNGNYESQLERRMALMRLRRQICQTLRNRVSDLLGIALVEIDECAEGQYRTLGNTDKEALCCLLRTEIDKCFESYSDLNLMIPVLTAILVINKDIIDSWHLSLMFAKIGGFVKHRQEVPIDQSQVEPFLLIVAEILDSGRHILNERDLGDILYGLIGFTEIPVEFEDEILERVADNEFELGEENVSRFACGIQSMYELSDNMVEALKQCLLCFKNEIPAAVVSDVLTSLYEFSDDQACRELIEICFRSVRSCPRGLNSIDLSRLVQLHAMYDQRCPSWLKRQFYNFLRDRNFETNEVERRIFRIIKGIYPYLDCKINFFIDGFELDIFLCKPDGVRVNVEIDGRGHENIIQSFRDQLRDDYMSSKDICVFRLPVDNYSSMIKLLIEQLDELGIR